MEKMNDLKDLLKHEVQDLYSAEEQIITALPEMVEKAKNPDLKKALQNHLKVTKQQLSRLEQVLNMLGDPEERTENKGLLSRLFKSRQVCKGMQGLIEEGNKVLAEDMHPDVMDAAIIASAQKIEHYEICGYGTARTFARELNLEQVAQMLEQTLEEEYEADDLMTELAVSRINKQAEKGAGKTSGTPERTSGSRVRSEERVRSNEPEMEMASRSRSNSSSGSRTSAATKSSAAPKGSESPRSTENRNRSTAASKRNTSAGSKSASGSSGTSGRSSGSGRGGSSSRTSRGR